VAQQFQAASIKDGTGVNHTPSSAVAAGQVVVQNSLVGVAKVPIEADRLGTLVIGGIFDVVKATGAINAGAALFWDADGDPQGGTVGTGAATTTSTNNSFMGFAITAAAETDEIVRMILVPVTSVTNTIHNDLTNVIADPGNGQAIPVTDSGHCSLVTTAAQTRTLAAPTNAGQLLALTLKTDGGNCVVTCATGVNQAGNNTLTFDDVGDTILLLGVEVGSNKRWRVLANDGVGVTTV